MYDKLSRFRINENTGSEPSGQPATVLGKPVDGPGGKREGKTYEDVATDILTKIGADEAKRGGKKEGSSEYFEFIREYVKEKKKSMEDMEPGEPAADPKSPDATTTNKELGERRGGKKEGDEPPPFIQAKIDAKKDKEKDEGRKREDGEDPEDDDDDPDAPESEKREARTQKTEAMIEQVLQGGDPGKIVEKLFRR